MKKTYVKIKHSEQVTFTVLVKQIKKQKQSIDQYLIYYNCML